MTKCHSAAFPAVSHLQSPSVHSSNCTHYPQNISIGYFVTFTSPMVYLSSLFCIVFHCLLPFFLPNFLVAMIFRLLYFLFLSLKSFSQALLSTFRSSLKRHIVIFVGCQVPLTLLCSGIKKITFTLFYTQHPAEIFLYLQRYNTYAPLLSDIRAVTL